MLLRCGRRGTRLRGSVGLHFLRRVSLPSLSRSRSGPVVTPWPSLLVIPWFPGGQVDGRPEASRLPSSSTSTRRCPSFSQALLRHLPGNADRHRRLAEGSQPIDVYFSSALRDGGLPDWWVMVSLARHSTGCFCSVRCLYCRDRSKGGEGAGLSSVVLGRSLSTASLHSMRSHTYFEPALEDNSIAQTVRQRGRWRRASTTFVSIPLSSSGR